MSEGVELYFTVIYSMDATSFEALFIALKKSNQFEGNERPEFDRAGKKLYKKIRNDMNSYERDYYDTLDIEGDGM